MLTRTSTPCHPSRASRYRSAEKATPSDGLRHALDLRFMRRPERGIIDLPGAPSCTAGRSSRMHVRRGSSTRTAWPSAAMRRTGPRKTPPAHGGRCYSFDDAYVARAVMGTREGGASRRTRPFDQSCGCASQGPGRGGAGGRATSKALPGERRVRPDAAPRRQKSATARR